MTCQRPQRRRNESLIGARETAGVRINTAALQTGGPPGSRFCPSNRCSPLPAERPAGPNYPCWASIKAPRNMICRMVRRSLPIVIAAVVIEFLWLIAWLFDRPLIFQFVS